MPLVEYNPSDYVKPKQPGQNPVTWSPQFNPVRFDTGEPASPKPQQNTSVGFVPFSYANYVPKPGMPTSWQNIYSGQRQQPDLTSTYYPVKPGVPTSWQTIYGGGQQPAQTALQPLQSAIVPAPSGHPDTYWQAYGKQNAPAQNTPQPFNMGDPRATMAISNAPNWMVGVGDLRYSQPAQTAPNGYGYGGYRGYRGYRGGGGGWGGGYSGGKPKWYLDMLNWKI